jgi:peptide/nickel transport system permease protein
MAHLLLSAPDGRAAPGSRVMHRYILQRLIAFIPILIGISLLVFLAIRLIPGDAIIANLGTEAGMLTQTQRESLERYYGIDKPVVEQYFVWAGEALQGNLGFSIRHGKPVLELILERFPLTFQLALMAVIIGVLVGVPFGILAAVRHNTVIDLAGRLFALAGLALPNFLIGTLIIYVLSVVFGILPTAGNYARFNEDPVKNLQQLIFPAITLGFSFAASVMRMTRSSMLEVLGEDYIRTARSKGLQENHVVLRHGLRNALIPVVTLIGIEMGYLLGGTFIVEHLYALPGLGRLTVNAISQREYALVQGSVLFIAVNFVFINLLVDFIYAAIDPRISYDRSSR